TTHRTRQKSGIKTVALVGYTNVGKSTLLNALTGAEVLVENKLFATLDPTARKLPCGCSPKPESSPPSSRDTVSSPPPRTPPSGAFFEHPLPAWTA
ncbi:GTPase, partial [Bittarella massiliensis (ex Durand et al. 2017)]